MADGKACAKALWLQRWRRQRGPEWLDKGARYEMRSMGTGTRPQDMGEPLKRFGW